MRDGEVLHVWVGSDVWQHAAGAERNLEFSIRKHASVEVVMHWMRAGAKGDDGTGEGWAISEHGDPGTWKVHRPIEQAWPKKGWGTPFSTFRLAIPECMDFAGVAVYLDVDMIVLSDIAELLTYPRRAPWLCNHPSITDVSVIDCAAFKDKTWWPSINDMMRRGTYLHEGRTILARNGFIDPRLPWQWNARDNIQSDTRLVHYTSVPWQPWRPYPTVKYLPHPHSALENLWRDTASAADKATR